MTTRRQLLLLLAVLIGGTALVSIVSTAAVFLIRQEILHLSRDTSPTQVRLARLQRGFERISGSFSRISGASTLQELSAVGTELDQTMTEVQTIAQELAGSAVSENNVIKDMRQTGDQLRRMANQRIESRKRIAEGNLRAAQEIETASAATIGLSAAMAQLQKSSQAALTSSRQTSLEANTSIKALLVERTKVEQLRSDLQQVRGVDKKFRLNPLGDKVAGILDSMTSQEVSDASLAARIKTFAANFTAALNGNDGLLATAGAVLTTPQDEKLKAKFDDQEKNLTAAIDGLARVIAAEIDPLELSVGKANTGMNRAMTLMAGVATVTASAAEVKARGRYIQALAWQLLAASDTATVDRIAADIAQQSEAVDGELASILENLAGLDRTADRGAAESARKSFAGVRQLLIGNSGMAPAVREGIDQQRQAESLFARSLDAIRQVALAGSSRARDAEGAQEQAVERIQRLAAGTFLIVGVVALFALGTGFVVGGRVRTGILNAEQRQFESATEMRRILEQMSSSARTLRTTSRGLTDASELVTRNVEMVASGAADMQTSIGRIASNAAEASKAGSDATGLAEAASVAVSGLQGASREIGKVTEMIRTVSFKTNLLALNAAVEAANAGSFGAGFAVVASEVKNLAQTTADLTADIDLRISGINDQVHKVTGSMDEIASIILQIHGMQETIALAVQRQAATTGQIAASIAATADGCRGDSSRLGIHAMALQLAGLAENLESLHRAS